MAASVLLVQIISTLCVLLFIRLGIFYAARKRHYSRFKRFGIPGPEPNLLDGNWLEYNKERIDEKYYWDLKERYGKCFVLFVGNDPYIFVTDLDQAKEIFIENGEKFGGRTTMPIESPICESVLLAHDDRWKPVRKVMSPQFSSYKIRGDKSTQFIEDGARLLIQYIEEKFDGHDSAIELDIHDLMKATTLYMISGLAIKLPGIHVRENDPNVRSLDYSMSFFDKGLMNIAVMMPLVRPLLEFLANHIEHGRALADIRRRVDELIDLDLKYLRKGMDSKTNRADFALLSTLIKMHHESKMTRREILGNVEGLLVAGYDTTSTALTHTFWTLGKHLDVQERLRSELITHGIESKYLTQVIYEVLRLYPPVFSFTKRFATETVKVGNLVVPKGAQVTHLILLSNRDPDYWPDPLKFDPERFREGVEHHPCAFAPFGLGHRKCLGYNLAMLELKIIICDMLLKFKITTKAPRELKLVAYALVLSKPKEKVVLELERFIAS